MPVMTAQQALDSLELWLGHANVFPNSSNPRTAWRSMKASKNGRVMLTDNVHGRKNLGLGPDVWVIVEYQKARP